MLAARPQPLPDRPQPGPRSAQSSAPKPRKALRYLLVQPGRLAVPVYADEGVETAELMRDV
ncbi:hypothetical protein DRB96_22670 [Streptomyces sp. ICC1]|nr:hypothetical protein DRB89_35500 [Streptomyces sp. ICC4]AWZ14596.1 hypothetical protein DRB96_22670 [Streptomyces sp. ICC1]